MGAILFRGKRTDTWGYKATVTMRERATGREWNITLRDNYTTLKEAQDDAERFVALHFTNGSPLLPVEWSVECFPPQGYCSRGVRREESGRG